VRVLWAPWRLAYIEQADSGSGCFFCDNPRLEDRGARRAALVLRSGEQASVVMNRFPYANAHLMVAPHDHTADFAALDAAVVAAVQSELQACVQVLTEAFSPQGFNVGMNLGRVAGAGVADHLHWHVVPRWEGDTNFMPVLGETKVMPEHIEATYDRLLPLFEERIA
jgi:ATP adenylyltransferase